RTGAGAPPSAISASHRDLIRGRHDGDLIRTVGRLLAHQDRQHDVGGEETLVLENGDTVLEAAWLSASTNALPTLLANARVEVTGICVVQTGPGDLNRSFILLLRRPDDVRYLGQTFFWNRPGVSRVLGIGSALALAGGLWVFLLRRQVTDR